MESPARIEAAHAVIERMRGDTHAADNFGGAQRRFEREQQQGGGVSLFLKILVDGELAEQHDGHGIGAVALLRLGKERALDLRGAESHIADDPSRRGVGDHIDARSAASLIGPRMASEPDVEGFPAAIEKIAIVILGQRTWRLHRHVIVPKTGVGGRVRRARVSPRRGDRPMLRTLPSPWPEW